MDEATLAWGRQHVLGPESASVRRRVELIQADVLDVTEPQVDLCCAMNFSFCVFKTRAELLRYFRAVHRGLVADGAFFTELYGGTDAITELEEDREEDGFTYIWEQEKYNPITHETVCHISFELPDGSRLERAFSYDWRLWSIPEVRECLAEAGFASSGVYWETTNRRGEGTGVHAHTEEAENQETWIVYIAATK